MTKDAIRVTTLQPALRWLQPMQNMHALREAAGRVASAATTDLLVLPEAFLGMPGELDDSGQVAGQGRQFLSVLAKAIGVAVVGGTVEHRDRDGCFYNSCFVVNPAGEEIARYNKRILFSKEAESRTPGNRACVFDLHGWRVGILICADLWYPELARELCGRMDLLCVPVKSSVPSERNVAYARHLWETLALIRAVENGCAVVTSDWAQGRHEAASGIQPTASPVTQTYYTSGAATVCNPAHRPNMDQIQSTLVKGQSGHLTVAIDRAGLDRFRKYRSAVGLLPTT
jgi:predicted amidohydrolase